MNDSIELTLEPTELAATIEALHEALMRRVRWTVYRTQRRTSEGWGTLDFAIAQAAIDQLAASLAKALFVLKGLDRVHPDFEAMFSPPEEIWDLITRVTLARNWDEAPLHPHHPEHECRICELLEVS